jgi:hypothetical protein
MSIPDIIYNNDETMSLKKQHIVDTNRLLQKSIRGVSLSSEDMMDLSTEHQRPSPTKKIPKHIHFESSSESESSSSSQSPTRYSKSNKRKKVSDTKKSRKQPAKKRARKTPDASDDTARKFIFL